MQPQKSSNSLYLIPIGIFIVLVIIIWRSYVFSQRGIASPFPTITLTTINDSPKYFSNKDLLGHVSLVNFWGSWCSICQQEHPMLMKIKQQYRIPVYGILYEDDPSSAKNWLQQAGNPYASVAIDKENQLAALLGVYGVPVTFVVDAKGIVRYRYLGAITEKSWENTLLPIINKYKT